MLPLIETNMRPFLLCSHKFDARSFVAALKRNLFLLGIVLELPHILEVKK